MLQIEKNLLKRVNIHLRDIYDKYYKRIQDSKDDLLVFKTEKAFYEAVIEKNEVLQELNKGEYSLIIYDIKNCITEEMINNTRDNPYIEVFSMVACPKYEADSKVIRILTTREWFHSRYSALLLNGWWGLINILSENGKTSFNLLDHSPLEKSNVTKRMITYLRKISYLSREEADEYIIQTMGEDLFSENKFQKLKNLIFYIQMAENSYAYKDYVYFDTFVMAYEMLKKYQRQAFLLYEKQNKFKKKINLWDKMAIQFGKQISNFTLSMKLNKLLYVANRNAMYNYWEMDEEKSEKFIDEEPKNISPIEN